VVIVRVDDTTAQVSIASAEAGLTSADTGEPDDRRGVLPRSPRLSRSGKCGVPSLQSRTAMLDES
jgi:hypothetical protein